jgi:hypothetical protein
VKFVPLLSDTFTRSNTAGVERPKSSATDNVALNVVRSGDSVVFTVKPATTTGIVRQWTSMGCRMPMLRSGGSGFQSTKVMARSVELELGGNV